MEDIRFTSSLTAAIIRLVGLGGQSFLAKLFISVSIFYLPIILSGLLLEINYNIHILSPFIHVALLWIGIAPLLIYSAYGFITSFFNKNETLFLDKNELARLRKDQVNYLVSPAYRKFGIVWGLSTSLVLVYSVFGAAPVPVKVWAFLSFFVLFFISSIGFYGIVCLYRLVDAICSCSLSFDLLAQDGYGGLSSLARFSVIICMYFSSGSLVFPLAYSIIASFSSKTLLISIIVMLFSAFYAISIFVGFWAPLSTIRKCISDHKKRILEQSNTKVKGLLSKIEIGGQWDVRDVAEVWFYGYFINGAVREIRETPINAKMVVQALGSSILPLVLSGLQVVYSLLG